MKKNLIILFLAAAGLSLHQAPGLAGQDLETLVKEVLTVPSPTGYENLLAAKIQGYLPTGWRADRDNVGSLYAFTSAKAEAGLVIAAPLDEFGYFVSGITPDGYLRIDRAVTEPVPIFNSFLLGHILSVSTKKGILTAICSVPAMHIMPRDVRDRLSRGITLDDVYLDIGVRSEDEAREKGVEILDAVTHSPDLAELEGEKWAAPSLGVKSGAAVLAALARDLKAGRAGTETALVWMAQTRFPARSQETRGALGALRMKNRLNPGQLILVDTIAADAEGGTVFIGRGPVLVQPREGASRLRKGVEDASVRAKVRLQSSAAYESALTGPFLKGTEDVLIIGLPVKFKSTVSEVVDMADLQALRQLLLEVLR